MIFFKWFSFLIPLFAVSSSDITSKTELQLTNSDGSIKAPCKPFPECEIENQEFQGD